MQVLCCLCIAQHALTNSQTTSNPFDTNYKHLYIKTCAKRDWHVLRTDVWHELQNTPQDNRIRCLYEIAKVLCGGPPKVLCSETLLWYMIHYLDCFRYTSKAPSTTTQDYLLQAIVHITSNKYLIAKYPVYVQQFIYLRITRAAAACNAITALRNALQHLKDLPCSQMQKFYWKQVLYDLDHGILHSNFVIGSDEEIQHYQRTPNLTSKFTDIEDSDLKNLHVNQDNVNNIFGLLRSRSVAQSDSKRLVLEMIKLEYYEYAVDLLEWYGEMLAPSDQAEAKLQAKAYFMCCEFRSAAELLREWELSDCNLYSED